MMTMRWKFTTSASKKLKLRLPSKAVLLSALGFAAYYRSVSAAPELIYQDNPGNRELIRRLPKLNQRYYPTPWLINTYLQLSFVELKRALLPRFHYERTDRLTAADGAPTALHWLGGDKPADTPILIVLHTIIGNPQTMRFFMSDLHRLTKFRVVLCERRGHGDSVLRTPRFNTMGDVQDLKQQIELIQARYPKANLYAAGVSAGTAVLVRYLGEYPESHPIKAAFMYCPGYDITTAFARSVPIISRIMTKKLARHFVRSRLELFEQLTTFKELMQSKDLHQFHYRLYEFAGYQSSDEYFAHCNPVHYIDKVKIPMLIVNSHDDPVCRPQNVYEHVSTITQLPSAVVAMTRRGSHCTHFHGLWPRAWSHELAADFFIHQETGL